MNLLTSQTDNKNMNYYNNEYRPVETGVSIVGKDAYRDYRLTSKIRDPKKFDYYTDYRRITRKIWKKIAESSYEYESGVYAKGFFYFVPQVIDNKPFIELPNGKIKANNHTNGDIYTPIFCNLFNKINHFCWSLDGSFTLLYKKNLMKKINKFVPNYFFILPTILANKF